MSDEQRAYIVRYPVGAEYLGHPIEFHFLARAAETLCGLAGCDLKTFDYEGIVEAGPRPGESAGQRTHVWSALRK